MNKYQEFCKPSMAAALNSVGLGLSFHRAKEQYLYTLDHNNNEQKILDLLGGYGAVLLGHNHQALVDTAITSLQENIAFHNQFSLRSGSADLAEQLNPLLQQETQWDETFICAFTSTGAESVEVAIKHAEFARGRKLDQLLEQINNATDPLKETEIQQWQLSDELQELLPYFNTIEDKITFIQQWNLERLNLAPEFIALKHSFHGKLNASLQMTYGEMYRYPFRRMGIKTHFFEPKQLTKESLQQLQEESQSFLLMPCLNKGKVGLEKLALPHIAAILVEPVQGEGGVFCLTEQDAQDIHQARKWLNCPVIADEVQSGCGRCGSFLAGSQIKLKPDYVVLSKALGGGIAKIGLVAIRQSVFETGFDLLQSSTFGEDDFSARVASKFIQTLTNNQNQLINQVNDLGDNFRRQLQQLQQAFPDVIEEIRGKGLLLGIVLKDQSNALSVLLRSTTYQNALGYLLAGHLLVQHHIRVAPPASAGNVIRLEPTLNTTEQNIQHFINAMTQICKALRYQDTGYIMSYLLKDAQALSREPQDFRDWYQGVLPDELSGEADYKVAFINHLISSDWLSQVDPSLAHFSDAQNQELLDRLSFDRRVAPFPPVRIKSITGQTVDFILYPINATSKQISQMLETGDLAAIRAAVDERLAAARDDGCKIAGLGMFTSIVSNNGKAVETAGIKLTTGNSLTVAMSAQAIANQIKKQNSSINQAAIIGAAGNIASVYSSLIAEYCDSIILIGSGRDGSLNRVKKTAYLVYQNALEDLHNNSDASGLALAIKPYAEQQGWLSVASLANKNIGKVIFNWFEANAPDLNLVQVSEQLSDIKTADLIVCAANASDAFISAEMLKENVIICDIAVPHNISEQALSQRPDITCLRGGIVQTPHNESLDSRARAYLKEGEVYACMAETLVLGLDKYQQHYSYGKITKSQVKYISERASVHGLSLSGNKQTESM